MKMYARDPLEVGGQVTRTVLTGYSGLIVLS